MKILYVILGDIPKEYFKIWKTHFENISPDNYIIVNHTKDNKEDSNYTIPDTNIQINYCQNENHIRTKWGGLSLVYATLMAIQYGITKSANPIDYCIFIPFDCLPIYNFNEIVRILSSIEPSRKYYCRPFTEQTYETVINKGSTLPSVAICSQWMILNQKQLYDYFDDELIKNKVRLYEKIPPSENLLKIEDSIRPVRKISNFFVEYHKILKNYLYDGVNKEIIRNYIQDKDFFDTILPQRQEDQAGGAYDENFFCVLPVKKTYANAHLFINSYKDQTQIHKELTKDKKKLVGQNATRIHQFLGYTNPGLENKSLVKSTFKRKEDESTIVDVYTYHDNLQKMSTENCPVYVNHSMMSFGCKAKISSIWINGIDKLNEELILKYPLNDFYRKLYEAQQSYFKLYNSNSQSGTMINEYFEKLEEIYKYIKDIPDANFSTLPNIEVGKRDHPVEMICEDIPKIKCALAYFRMLEYISMIKAHATTKHYELYNNKYNFVSVWALVAGEYDEKDEYLYFYHNLNDQHSLSIKSDKLYTFTSANYFIQKLKKYQVWAQNTTAPEINLHTKGPETGKSYKDSRYSMYIQHPLYINNHIGNALDSGCLFFRKILFKPNYSNLYGDITNYLNNIQLSVFDALNKNSQVELPTSQTFQIYTDPIQSISLSAVNNKIKEERNKLILFNTNPEQVAHQLQEQLQEQLQNSNQPIIVPQINWDDPPGKYIFNAFNRNKIDIQSKGQLRSVMEDILNKIVDIVFKVTLRDIRVYDFVIVGGKIFENVFGKKNYSLSFDYDIHLLDRGASISGFSKQIVSVANSKLKRDGALKFFGMYVYNILKKYHFVTPNEFNYYKNGNLFYYGKRQSINSIFIKLKLRDDLVIDQETGNNHFMFDNNSGNNEMYLAIADIDHEAVINFGIDLSKKLIFSDYNSLKYAPYEYATFNIFQYYCMEKTSINPRDFKVNKMENKLRKICDFTQYTTDFLLKYQNDKLPQLLPTTDPAISTYCQPGIDFFKSLPINTHIAQYALYNLNQNNQTLQTTLNRLFTALERTTRLRIPELRMDLSDNTVLNNSIPSKTFIYQNGTNDTKAQVPDIIEYLRINDLDKYIASYTENEYKTINEYLVRRHFGIQDMDITIQNKCDEISRIIQDASPHQSYNSNIRDEFEVYSMRHFMIVDFAPNELFFVPEISQIGYHIYFPFFSSTSMSTNFNYSTFYKEGCFLMKIKIKKSTDNWIIVDGYSSHESEKEIIIDKKSYFKITNISYQYIYYKDEHKEIQVLEVELLPRDFDPSSIVQLGGGENKIINTVDPLSREPNIMLYDTTYDADVGYDLVQDVIFQKNLIEEIINYQELKEKQEMKYHIKSTIKFQDDKRELVSTMAGGTDDKYKINNYKSKYYKYLAKNKNKK